MRRIWITSKHFPYGVSEIEKANLTSFSSEKVKPPRIRECVVHIECKVLWTKPIGSSCIVLAEIVSISASKKMKRLDEKNRLVQLNPLLYFAFKEVGEKRTWMFAAMAKIHKIVQKNDKIRIISETL